MTAIFTGILNLVLPGILLAGTPLLLTRRMTGGRTTPAERYSTAGILAVALALVVALVLHGAAIPITPDTLTLSHLALFAVALMSTRLPPRNSVAYRPDRFTLAGLILLFFILFPYTRFTGIDTYKWQDLATSVRMEQSLPWIVHPLSLFGFTPRAYPPACPVLLATVQMAGRLGVDSGFAVVSFFIALLGVATSTQLAGRLFSPRLAIAAGLLYGFSPVFIRYSHWATGRGLFLAVFPALIAVLLPVEQTPSDSGGGTARLPGILRKSVLIIGLAVLLLLTHKVALVAVPLTLLAALLAALMPRCWHLPASLRIGITLPFIAAALAIVTPTLLPGVAGLPCGVIRTGILRFVWMLPLALAGLWLPPPSEAGTVERGVRRMLFIAALPAVPLAFERQMYGALYALPFICLFAVDGLERLTASLSARLRRGIITGIALLTVLAAIATVVGRSQIACTPALYRAAMFLEAHDPQGPFMIHAPGMSRTRIQAYVSGCARFDVRPGARARLQWPALPPHPPTLRAAVDAWSSTLRGLFTLSDTTIDWYGSPQKNYYFIINGQGDAPANATCIYDRDGISIHEQATALQE